VKHLKQYCSLFGGFCYDYREVSGIVSDTGLVENRKFQLLSST